MERARHGAQAHPSHTPAGPQAAAPALADQPAPVPTATVPNVDAPHGPPGNTAAMDAGWLHAVATWLAAHKTYPDEARRRGEEGRLAVRFTMDRSGRVDAAEIVRSSGSAALDRAALAMLQGAMLPALPETTAQSSVTVTVQIRYALSP